MFRSCYYSGGKICSFPPSGDIKLVKYISLGSFRAHRQNDWSLSSKKPHSRLRGFTTSQTIVKNSFVSFEAHDGVPLKAIPKHVAIIMDGNGRWAGERGYVASMGHKAGIDALRTVVEGCIEFGIRYLSVFALSTENSTSRNEQEIKFLVSLIDSVVHERLKELHSEGVRLKFVGDVSSLGNDSLTKVIGQCVMIKSILFKFFIR